MNGRAWRVAAALVFATTVVGVIGILQNGDQTAYGFDQTVTAGTTTDRTFVVHALQSGQLVDAATSVAERGGSIAPHTIVPTGFRSTGSPAPGGDRRTRSPTTSNPTCGDRR